MPLPIGSESMSSASLDSSRLSNASFVAFICVACRATSPCLLKETGKVSMNGTSSPSVGIDGPQGTGGPNSGSSGGTSTSFIVFEGVMFVLCIISWLLMKRRRDELGRRQQQRYRRLANSGTGGGGSGAPSSPAFGADDDANEGTELVEPRAASGERGKGVHSRQQSFGAEQGPRTPTSAVSIPNS